MAVKCCGEKIIRAAREIIGALAATISMIDIDVAGAFCLGIIMVENRFHKSIYESNKFVR